MCKMCEIGKWRTKTDCWIQVFTRFGHPLPLPCYVLLLTKLETLKKLKKKQKKKNLDKLLENTTISLCTYVR